MVKRNVLSMSESDGKTGLWQLVRKGVAGARLAVSASKSDTSATFRQLRDDVKVHSERCSLLGSKLSTLN